MQFEWDEAKRESNIRKHGIDFLNAIQVFTGRVFTKRSDRAGEHRNVAFGELANRIIAIVYTDRSVDRVVIRRIISARRARGNEEEAYREESD